MSEHPHEDRQAWEGELFRLLVENIEDYAIFIIDPEGLVQSWSHGAERLLGYRESEIVGRSADRFYIPEDLRDDVPRMEMHEALTTGRGVDDRWHVRKDDSRFWASGMMTALKDNTGRLRGFAKIMRDRTEWWYAEQARHEVEARKAAILETALDCIISIDHDGKVIEFNPAAERIFGFNRAEVSGRELAELIIPPGLRDRHRLGMSRYLATGEAPVLGKRIEIAAMRADGTEFPVELAITRISTDGPPVFTAYLRDISERKQQEAAISEQNRLAEFGRDIGLVLTQSGSLGEMLSRITELTVGSLDGAFARIWTTNETGDVLELKASAGLHTHLDGPHSRVAVGRHKIGRIAQDRRPHLTNAVIGDPLVPDQEWAEREGMVAFAGYPLVVDDRLVGVWAMFARHTLSDVTLQAMASVADGIAVGIEQRRAEARLREQTRIAETLYRIGGLLAAELDIRKLVQVVTDETTRLIDARFGAFFADSADERGESCPLDSIASAPRDGFSRFPMPRNTSLFEPTFRGEAVVRLADVTQDALLGPNIPDDGCPEGDPPVRSYLAVPVKSRSGAVIGGLFFGHPEAGVFDEGDERVVVGVAAQAAIALDNARLFREAHESGERFRNLAGAMPQIVWIAMPDSSIEFYNDRWFQYTGLSPEQAYAPESWKTSVHPDDIARIVEANAVSHSLGEPFEAEYRLKNQSGNYRWHLGRAVAVCDEAGRIVRRFGTATDIDDRKRAENAARFLAEASSTLATLVDEASTLQQVASLAVPSFADWCSVDMAGDDGIPRRLAVAHIDPAKVESAHDLHRRYPPDPEAPSGVPQVIRTGESNIVAEITDELLVAGAKDAGHLRILRDLGLRSSLCVPLKGRGGTLGAISFVAAESGRSYGPDDLRLAEDLGRRAAIAIENARLYGELKETDRRKNEFLATLAHELRNPLAPIRNTLHLMRQPDGDGPMEDERAMAERQVVHLARLIDDLMDVARISRGKIELQKEVVDLARVVNQAVETARPLIDERRHQLTVHLPLRGVRLEADPTRLEQVLWNLLNNAAKYSEPGGRIDLRVEPEGTEVVLRVRDAGIGIRPEMLPHIFEMFVQVGDHKDHSQGGLGIGLSLVKTLVEMHGGSIAAQSQGPGMGSEFVVRLPVLTQVREVERAVPDRRRKTDDPPPQRRVLVVDDNVDAAGSLARLLVRLYGQQVRVAHDGPEALSIAEEFRPEVVLLDIGLPGMSGYEVAERLRRRPEFKTTLIVALTGWGQEDDRRRSVESGIDRHLVKPVNPDAILELLAGIETSNG